VKPADDSVEHVAIAIVEHEGRYLVGTRGPDQPLPGRAEFPGGRCLPGEGGQACVVRECREETGLAVTAIRLLNQGRHTYPHGTLDLEFWLCRLESGESENRPENGFAWVPAEALHSLDFPEANRPVLEILTAGSRSAS
jgi:mutator protein MutT